jgi:GNAT superfamily N-acetyltransferase
MVDLPFPQGPVSAAPDAGVRPARPSDAADIADVQLAVWRQRYADVLPVGTLGPAAAEQMAEHWAGSVADPPTALHAVLVATSGRLLVGYVVTAPSADEDGTGEVVDLEVRPDATRLGHGSRLLAAAVDHLRGHGSTAVAAWCGETDAARRAFLESAGLAPDGVRRRLDMGEGTPGVAELRLSARLDEPGADGGTAS